MLSEQQLISLKNELLNQKKQLDTSEDETSIQDNNIRDTTGELSLYDNHPADLGTELFEREKDMALSIHSESQLDKVMDAIQAHRSRNLWSLRGVQTGYTLRAT